MKTKISLITKVLLQEARKGFDIRYTSVGAVPFKNSQINDPHIQEIVKKVSDKTGVSQDQIYQKIQSQIIENNKLKEISKPLYDNMAENAANSAAFDIISHAHDHDDFSNRVKFSSFIFGKLVNEIRKEYKDFLPLVAQGQNIAVPFTPILVGPNDDPQIEKKYGIIDTAAVNTDGVFIFNKKFMQKLLDFAVAENLQMPDDKYQSKGGEIPDAYGLIETLIVHEIMHYVRGDVTPFSRTSLYSHDVHNIAQDYIINYFLLKNKYPQLPIGLYSDHINTSRQGTYMAVLDLVAKELEKLSPKDKSKLKPHDEHADVPNDQGEKSGEEGTKGNSPGQEETGGKAKEGQGEKRPTKNPVNPQDGIDKMEEMLNKRQENLDKDSSQSSENKPSRSGGSGGQGLGTLKSREDEMKNIAASVNWKELLNKMFNSVKTKMLISYAQINPKITTSIGIGMQTGSYALPPGKLPEEIKIFKICLVIDTSGTMFAEIPQILSESTKLLTQLKTDSSIGIVYFSGDAQYYQVNLKNNTYVNVSNANEIKKLPAASKPIKGWRDLLKTGSTGGTSFSESITGNLKILLNDGWNIVLFSDSDILDGSNWKNFLELYKSHPARVGFIATTQEIFEKAILNIKSAGGITIPKNWTYIHSKK